MDEELKISNAFKEIFLLQNHAHKIFIMVLDYGLRIVVAVFLWCILRFIVKRLGNLFFKACERSKLETRLDSTVLNFFRSFFRVVIDMVLILMILPYLGVPTTSIFAVFGSLGLAVGLAAQGMLSNFVSGFVILNSNFFKIGDYVSCDDAEGEVIDIQIFFTTLRTVDGKIIKIPNSKFTNTLVVNFSSNPERRVAFSFQVPYSINISLLKEKMGNLALSFNRERYDVREPSLIVTEYTPCYIVMEIRCFIRTEFFWDFQYFLAENIKGVLNDVGVEFPIHIVNLSKFR
ncbi:mechanosensitive ion channel family protein [Borrelia persica]|uniref:mechanosensitive ion channel family protein n=1 Tax=Borrelia persica TaxID=44448 RepID=UPI0004666D0F|nr:mechanosensitive ion channel family protein [Borrelia persica]